jgi:hypothetical protein
MKNYDESLLSLSFMVDGRKTLPHNPNKTWGKRDPVAIEGVVLHQSLEAEGSAVNVSRYHSGPNHISADGMPGLSYTVFVEKDGKSYLANNVDDKTLSQGDASKPGDENAMYLAICVGGNFSGQGYQGTEEPTDAQVDSIHGLWIKCKELWSLKNNKLFGHYHFGKPACPGFTITHIIETYNLDKDWTDPMFDLSEIEGRQQALAKIAGYTGAVNGFWSNECRFALTEFQKKAGLEPDGVWGPKTAAAISKALGA